MDDICFSVVYRFPLCISSIPIFSLLYHRVSRPAGLDLTTDLFSCLPIYTTHSLNVRNSYLSPNFLVYSVLFASVSVREEYG